MREGKRKKATCASLTALLVVMCSTALADGGTLRASSQCGGYQISVFTSPEVLRVGAIDVSVLVQDAESGRILSDVPVTVTLESDDGRGIKLEQVATPGAATNKLFSAAQFELPFAGQWRGQVQAGADTNELAFEFDVASPLPPWIDFAPWVLWPFAAVGLFVVHQALVAHSASRRGHLSGRAAGAAG